MRLFLLFVFLVVAQHSFCQLIPIQQNGKWGYCNEELEFIIPCQYDAAYPFADNRALVEVFNYEDDKNEHRACFINPQGKVVFCWDVFAQGFPASRFQDGVAIIENYGYQSYQQEPMLSIVDTMGAVLQEIKGAQLDFQLSMYYTYSTAFNASGIYSSNWHKADSNGTVLIYKDLRKPKYLPYQFITQFKDGVAIATVHPEIDEEGYPTALIDSIGNVLIPARQYKMIPNYESDVYGSDQLIAVEKDGKYGYIDTSGALLIPYQFDNAQAFSAGMAAVGKTVDEDEYGNATYYWGYIDKKGDLKIDYQYITAFNFSEELAEVRTKEEIQFINTEGDVLLKFEQETKDQELLEGYPYGAYVYQHGFHNGRAILFQNDQIGWINKKGEFIIPPFYIGLGRIGPSMIVYDFKNGLSKMMHPDGAEIYINEQGKQYYLPTATILAKTQGRKAAYSSISPLEFADSIHSYQALQLIRQEKGSNFLVIKHYNPNCKYVRTEDYYQQALYCNQIAQLYEKIGDASPKLELLTNSRLHLAEGENKRRVRRKNKWLKVVYYGPLGTSYDYGNQYFYIKSDQVDFLKF